MTSTVPRADVGVFGGSGFTHLLDDVETVEVTTEFGAPSAPIAIGQIADRRVAFLARHGDGHQHPPHTVNYRANIAAMRQLGVQALFAPFAAGSLQSHLGPGDLVVVDQFVDRTSGRAETFHDHFDDGPCHLTLPDPYDPELRGALLAAGRAAGVAIHDGGTVVVVNGPRFSTRAESRWFRQQGWDLVNMTQHPEAALAGEAGIPYAGLAIVTDHDAGVEDDPSVEAVTQDQVFAAFDRSIDAVRSILVDTIAGAPVRA
jgi:5'-methylthioadenosine phosphorylase